jgi:hypothetical protein
MRVTNLAMAVCEIERRQRKYVPYGPNGPIQDPIQTCQLVSNKKCLACNTNLSVFFAKVFLNY